MKKTHWILLLCLFAVKSSFAQTTDTANAKQLASVFERLTREMGGFKPDTTAPPADKVTQKIIELRSLRGGFNINEAIAFKLEEEKQKGEMPADAQQKMKDYFTTGNGGRLLDNAVIWIYRKQFTYDELKDMVKFYKTAAGQKMAEAFPLIMLKSLAAGEMLKKGFETELKQQQSH